MEELKEIEPVAKLFASVNDVSIREINLEEIGHEVRFIDVYTAEQMQEYAEDKCWELINWYVESTGDVNHAAEMKIWMDDKFEEG
uniref:hypothetical protein n=1 Tax=Lactococcus garvieae TaxID=1363 RepID=UPI00359C8EA4